MSWAENNPVRYNGQYYDEETGMYYLRARYYDPQIRRFISEDPIKDGVNWYAYCGNNPVNFTDPSGLEMRVVEDVNKVFPYIQSLTDDVLSVDIDGYINIETYGRGEKNVGTEMIRRLIANNLTCKIVGVEHLGDSSHVVYDDRENAATLGIGSGSTIIFNYKKSFEKNLENYIKEQSDDTIRMALAHELIHALRGMGGYNKIGSNNTNIPGMNQEEGETVGIDYINKSTGKLINTSKWYTTENAVRVENGLAKRVKY